MDFCEEDHRDKVLLSTYRVKQGYILSAWFMTDDVVLDHPTEVVVFRFLHCQVNSFLPLSILSSLEATHCAQHTLKEWGVLIYSINFISMESWIFILYFGRIQYYSILLLKSFWLWPLGALSVDLIQFLNWSLYSVGNSAVLGSKDIRIIRSGLCSWEHSKYSIIAQCVQVPYGAIWLQGAQLNTGISASLLPR